MLHDPISTEDDPARRHCRYQGHRRGECPVVTVDGAPLHFGGIATSFDPVEFDWGHACEGCDVLALALLIDHLGSLQVALRLRNRLAQALIEHLPAAWTLTSEDIDAALAR